jgi:putative DNA primase/helicase
VAESVQIGDLHKDLLPRVGSQLSGEKRIADTFCDLYQNKLIYTPGRHWMKFNGSYWENCDGDVEVWRAMEKVCSYLLTAASCTEDPERGELIGLVQKLNGSGFTKSVLEHLKRWPGIAVPDSELDSDAGLFAVSNGVIDLYEGGFRSALPTDYLTMAGGCAFDPDATCPQYDALMDLYHPEKEMQDYLHRLAGAAMEGKQNLQNIVVWFGETAGNGKGTTERIWSRVFGTYARSIPVEVIASKGAYDQYRDEKAKLKGARLVFTTEPSEGMRFSSGTVNSLTGGDAITSREVYKGSVTFDPTWLIMMSTNTRIGTSGSPGTERRIKEIPWEYTIPRDKMDSRIEERLALEAPGILNRILRGWYDFRSGGVQHPKKVEEATALYLAEVDPIKQFLGEKVIMQIGSQMSKAMVYQSYTSWCETNGERPRSHKSFTESMRREGLEEGKTGALGRFWKDITLVS